MFYHQVRYLAIIGLIFFGSIPCAYAQKMYRWVDDQGKVHFSDQVPAEHAKFKRELLSPNATVLDVVEKEKNAEELKLQKQLDAERLEQEKRVAKQKEKDNVLLNSFTNVDEMKAALANKQAVFAARQQMINNNINQFEHQLQQQQQHAAEFERNAQKIPEKLIQDMQATQQQIETAKQDLIRKEEENKKMEVEYKVDIERYQLLTKTGGDKTQSPADLK